MRHYASDARLDSFAWPSVAAAFWRRYPNRFSKHVLSEDVVRRRVDSAGRLHTVRVLTKTNRLPRWAERFAGAIRNVVVVEESVVDPSLGTMVTYTRNVGSASQRILSVEEKCTYSLPPAAPVDCERGGPKTAELVATAVHRDAWIVSPIGGLSGALLERFGYERFKMNANNALKGFADVLHLLFPRVRPADQFVARLAAVRYADLAQWKRCLANRCRQSLAVGAHSVRNQMPTLNRAE